MKLCILAALAACLCLGCANPPSAQTVDTIAVDLTGAVCTALEGQPLGQPWVDIVCTLAQGAATAVGSGVALSTASDAGPGTVRTVKLRVPPALAQALIAAHP